jgi:hypothetical protein
MREHLAWSKGAGDRLHGSGRAAQGPGVHEKTPGACAQVQATFAGGLAEHLQAAGGVNSAVAAQLQEAAGRVGAAATTLSGQVADGQRRLVQLAEEAAAAGGFFFPDVHLPCAPRTSHEHLRPPACSAAWCLRRRQTHGHMRRASLLSGACAPHMMQNQHEGVGHGLSQTQKFWVTGTRVGGLPRADEPGVRCAQAARACLFRR